MNGKMQWPDIGSERCRSITIPICSLGRGVRVFFFLPVDDFNVEEVEATESDDATGARRGRVSSSTSIFTTSLLSSVRKYCERCRRPRAY